MLLVNLVKFKKNPSKPTNPNKKTHKTNLLRHQLLLAHKSQAKLLKWMETGRAVRASCEKYNLGKQAQE